VLSQSIQARILPLRSVFRPDNALVFPRNIRPSLHFRVKKIEVFEITAQTALPIPAHHFLKGNDRVSPERHLSTLNGRSFLTNGVKQSKKIGKNYGV
jgi:hypothetical protein